MGQRLDIEGLDTIVDILPDFLSSLRARNRSPRTAESYAEACRLLSDFLTARHLPTEIADIRRSHVEAFIADQLERWKPTTAAVRFRALRPFFNWCVAQDKLAVSPMAGMSPPQAEAPRIEIIPAEQMRGLLKVTAADKDFDSYRDVALLRVFYDTGARLSELVNLKIGDIDLNACTSSCSGRAAATGWSPSARRPSGRCATTSAPGAPTPSPRRSTGSGLGAGAVSSPSRASRRCSGAAVRRPAWRRSTRTSSATAPRPS